MRPCFRSASSFATRTAQDVAVDMETKARSQQVVREYLGSHAMPGAQNPENAPDAQAQPLCPRLCGNGIQASATQHATSACSRTWRGFYAHCGVDFSKGIITDRATWGGRLAEEFATDGAELLAEIGAS